MARSILFQSSVPLKYWDEAVLTSVFLINRTPTSVLNGASPFEFIYKRAPKFDHLRVFGCLCFSTKLNIHDKFSEKADKCILLGYSTEQKGYKLLNLNTKSVFVSRDVKFYESVFPFKFGSDNTEHNTVPDFQTTWDPFSYDESDMSDLMKRKLGLNYQAVTPPSGPLNEDQVLEGGNGPNPNHGRNQTGGALSGQNGENETGTSNLTEESSTESLIPPVEQSSSSPRPSRNTRMPLRFDDYIVEGKHKYGIERTVNYSHLDKNSKCFVSNLNKTVEPKNFTRNGSKPSVF